VSGTTLDRVAPAASDTGMSGSAIIRTSKLRKVYPAPKLRGGGSGWGRPAGPLNVAPAPARDGAPPTEVIALEGLDLEIGEGEIFGLLGPNGAGKTTTIGILTTRVRPTAGDAWVAGAHVVRESTTLKQRIGVVPQSPNPDRSLNVRENLVFHATYFGLARAEADARARRLLDRFGIGDRSEAKVGHLSGGQQQRLMIARALIHEPRILFLDEPTVGLDPQARLSLWEILREMHAQGRTIVLTTHYMEEADQLCERLAIVDNGRLLALDTPAGLKARAPGGTLIELTLDGDPAPVVPIIRTAPGVLSVEVETPRLRIWVERPGEAIGPLTRAAESVGRVVQNIHLAPPSLETLFISMTGRKLE